MDLPTQELTRFSELVDLIYEGATAPGDWSRRILPAVAHYLDAPSCILYSTHHTPQDGGYFFLHGIDQEHVDQYIQKYYDVDVWKMAMQERNLYSTGNVLIGDELVERSRLLESDFYKQCLSRNQNMAQVLAGIVFGKESSTSLPTVCSFFRGMHHPDFDQIARTRLGLLLPHLSRALGVMQRLRCSELTLATSLEALDRLPSAVLLLDHQGRVGFANGAAKNMLTLGDGLYLRRLNRTVETYELVGETSAVNKAIKIAIDSTLNASPLEIRHFSKSLAVPHLSSTENYVLQFSALGMHNEFGGEDSMFAAIIFISDGAARVRIDLDTLQAVYGMTPMEARVAASLVEHESAKEVADFLGISANTVRTHIQNIYAKLSVDTRTRFVKVMLGTANGRS
ncbi:LuxR C-terminal-related transcriptional regulator [Herbaspirillum rubrisubalbicans]|uniref:LuxR C-terminal-related transcriptional regulator n=1 Tax=Herbaspirillum rubrisubalbicans TaxID=80842 RepID=UPI0015C55026